ncbi:glucose 1-dehydrogenase [Prescottella equi]|uniref:SDR family NAD(P)-dependent oxidoreductase n=1 Tax=Rhodococcus hoagii TaxID=43767 RepID=UPI00301C26FC
MEPAAQRFAGKTVLVTGASGGQGEAQARLFAAEGAVVVIADILIESGEALAAELVSAGMTTQFVDLDVRDESRWAEVVTAIEAEHGQLDVLVNNAGVCNSRGVVDQGLRGWNHVLDTNLWGPVLGMRAVAPLMRINGGGAIVNVASIAGMTGYDHAAYTASKWGLRGVTRTAALEFAEQNIRVNTVNPGTIATPMVTATSDEGIENFVRINPLGRIGDPVEVAWAVLHLASDESTFTTGAELTVDGGFIAAGANRALDLLVRRSTEARSL